MPQDWGSVISEAQNPDSEVLRPTPEMIQAANLTALV